MTANIFSLKKKYKLPTSFVLDRIKMINVFRPFSEHNQRIQAPNPFSYDAPSVNPSYTVERLTRDVEIKPIHSHNDYWRTRPLIDALSVGAQSVEGDIWYFPHGYTAERTVTKSTCEEIKECKANKVVRHFKNDEIYVGHNQIYLEPHSTLDNLYFNPLFDFLQSSNINLTFDDGEEREGPLIEQFNSKFGVFYNSPETPLYFWLDFKTSPKETYTELKKYLKRFIDNDYLAYFDTTTKTFVPGPLIITITGNIPWQEIELETKRYVFVDVPLADFANDEIDKSKLANYAELGVIASGSFSDLVGGKDNVNKLKRVGNISELNDISERVTKIFDHAHEYGLKTRVWGGINWPNYVRNGHIKSLWQYGCDLVNVDDLHYASDIF